MQQSINTKNPQKIPHYNRSEVYKLTCKTCNMSYIWQNIRDLTQKYREHIRYIRNNDPQSAYSQHILRNQHEYGTITDTMTSLKPIHKTSMLILYEQLFIQTFQHSGNLITDQIRDEQNPLFQLAIDTGLTSQLFHNSTNSKKRSNGSRPGYEKTTFIWSQWCYFRSILISKSGMHTIVLTDFSYCIFR